MTFSMRCSPPLRKTQYWKLIEQCALVLPFTPFAFASPVVLLGIRQVAFQCISDHQLVRHFLLESLNTEIRQMYFNFNSI